MPFSRKLMTSLPCNNAVVSREKKKKTLVWYYLSLFASEAADKEKNIPRHVLQQHLGGWNVKDTDVQW